MPALSPSLDTRGRLRSRCRIARSRSLAWLWVVCVLVVRTKGRMTHRVSDGMMPKPTIRGARRLQPRPTAPPRQPPALSASQIDRRAFRCIAALVMAHARREMFGMACFADGSSTATQRLATAAAAFARVVLECVEGAFRRPKRLLGGMERTQRL